MNEKIKKRWIRFAAFSPFLAFAPCTLIFSPLFFWAFWIYFILWLVTYTVIYLKNSDEQWLGKLFARFFGIIGLEMIISLALGIWITWDMYEVRGADGKLKTEQNIEPIPTTPVE